MHYQTSTKTALLSVLLATTAACTNETAAPVDQTPPQVSSGNTKADVVHTQTVKPGAGLTFSYRMASPIKANTSNSAVLTIAHDYAGDNLLLTANSDDALKLAAKTVSMRLIKGRDAAWTIPFTVTAEGVYYINIIGRVTALDGTAQVRSYAIRVQVGDQSGNKKLPVDEVILPAEEKIS